MQDEVDTLLNKSCFTSGETELLRFVKFVYFQLDPDNEFHNNICVLF